MKNYRRKITGLLLALLIFMPQVALARENFSWDKTSYIYGAGLSNDQINNVANILGLDIDKVNMASVGGKDLEKYVGYGANDSDMISSVSVKKLDDNSGIKVNIITPEKITSVTANQYTNAAITAGISDAEINVASPSVVTGESALVGVYKAVELNGSLVDTQRTEVAQEEIATLKEVSEENKENENFDKEKLDKVVIEVKQDLSNYKKENNGKLADSQQIKIFIEDALKNVNMGDILSNNNIEILVNYFEKYQNTKAIDSKEVEENLSKLAAEIKDGATKIYEENKDQIDQMANDAKESGLLDQIIEFFKEIFNSIAEMFGTKENE